MYITSLKQRKITYQTVLKYQYPHLFWAQFPGGSTQLRTCYIVHCLHAPGSYTFRARQYDHIALHLGYTPIVDEQSLVNPEVRLNFFSSRRKYKRRDLPCQV